VNFLHEVNNCGFVSWFDGSWPATLDIGLPKLWEIYHSINHAEIDDKIEHARFVEELSMEKKKLEKKYSGLFADVKKFTNETDKRMVQHNFHKIETNSLKEDEMEALNNELSELKDKEKAWKAKREAIKEENNKLRYMLFSFLKDGTANTKVMKM
jgi:hypothetical protein